MPAHLTLVHALPPSGEGEVRRLLARLAADWPALAVQPQGWRQQGSHVSLGLASDGLAALHAELMAALAGLVSAQDRGRPRFHVTVQDKGKMAAARALAGVLPAPPGGMRVVALRLWRYLDGPWEAVLRAPLRGRP